MITANLNFEYIYTHQFDKDFALTIDGKEAELISTTNNEVTKRINSMTFAIEFVVEAETSHDPIIVEPEEGKWTEKYGAIHYEYADGSLATGIQKIGEDYYLFNNRGTLQSNVFYEENDKTYFFGKDGKMVTGFMSRWSATYYFNEEGVMQTGFVDINGDTYFFKNDGKQTKSTWITVDGNKFYTKTDGKLAKSETIFKWGKKYTFDENGVLIHRVGGSD